MPTVRDSGTLINTFSTNLADNNSGAISAADIRVPLEDFAFSVNALISSGNTDSEFPFYNDVRAKEIAGAGGTFIAESGIIFPNAPTNPASRQVEPFLGIGNLQHNDMAGLTVGNVHTQYVHVDGSNTITGNIKFANTWLGASGNSNVGFKFAPNGDGTETILTSGTVKFEDNSTFATAKGVAKAWINFDGSGSATNEPVVRDAYNVSGIQRTAQGKYKITFNSGVFENNNYVCVAMSNATTASGSQEDFDLNTVGCVLREGDDGTALRTVTFVVRNDNGEYVDSEMCDLVVYGRGPSVTADTAVTIVT